MATMDVQSTPAPSITLPLPDQTTVQSYALSYTTLFRSIRRPSPAMIVAMLALVVAVGGVAFASIPDPSGVIRGCYDTSRGTLRGTDTATNTPPSCTSTETAISWNQAGPQGTQGPQGPQG